MLLLMAALCGCDETDADDPPLIVIDAAVTPDAVAPPLDAAADMLTPDGAPPDMAADMAADMALDMMPDMAPDMATPLPACRDGADDDGDGFADYPLDPGCEDPDDDDEADPAAPACGDGADNDGDGRIDHPDDPGCADPADPSEASACGDAEIRDITGLARVEGDTRGGLAARATCRNNLAPEALFRFTLRAPVARLRIDTAGSSFDTLLGVYRDCEGQDEVACNDDVGGGAKTSEVVIEQPALGDYVIVVDGFADGAGPFVLNVRGELAPGAPCLAPIEGEPAPAIDCGRGQTCRDGACVPAACADGLDNDGDGRVDYPNEPGCETPVDDDEQDPDVLPACADGADNDFDFAIDYPADPNCASAADTDENSPPQCSDGRDNDGDGLVDLADPGCLGDPNRFSEFNTAACRNRLDDDGDALVDYPFDPGCATPNDTDEADPATPPACANGVDDDGDGLVDHPADAESCLAASDDSEDDACERVVPRDITGLTRTAGNTDDAANDFIGSCQAAGSSNEDVLVWRVAEGRALDALVLDARDSAIDTVIHARDGCAAAGALGCNDNGGGGLDALLQLGPQPAGREIWIFVDANPGAIGIWRLRITALLAEGQDCGRPGEWRCGEGLACVDTPAGPRCERAVCDNGADDDGDGLTDFPADPGCAAASDPDEADPAVLPACANGVDDDGDGVVDWPDDPSCLFAADPAEEPDCADGVDNDGDGLVDFDRDDDGVRGPNADPQCACATDESEAAQPQCADQCDNDGDGLVDLEDPGCADATDQSEFNPPACQDGLDNDGDGRVDYPTDPGCTWLADPSEQDPVEPPACDNGQDDDDDGALDYPFDPGCAAAADPDERARCDAGVPLFPPDATEIRGDTRAGLPENSGTCRVNQAPDVTWRVPVPYPARVVADTVGSGFDTVLYARSSCGPELICPPDDPACVPLPSELACDDDGAGVQSRVSFDFGGGELYLVVDGFSLDAGLYRLAVLATYPRGGQCGPETVAYAGCEAGTVCALDPELGIPVCGDP
ncbi:MAG: hypothetical protein R3F65_01315 [bacterium]